MNGEALLSIALHVLGVIVLVLLNGFFVAAEFGLVKVRDTQLSPLARDGQRRAQVAVFILQRLDSFLSAAQLGITLTSLGLGWIGAPVFAVLLKPVFDLAGVESPELREWVAFLVGFSIITFLHISAGEQAPKWLAIQKPLATTLWVSYPLLWFYRASYPFVVLLNDSAQWMLRQVGLGPTSEGGRTHSGSSGPCRSECAYLQPAGSDRLWRRRPPDRSGGR